MSITWRSFAFFLELPRKYWYNKNFTLADLEIKPSQKSEKTFLFITVRIHSYLWFHSIMIQFSTSIVKFLPAKLSRSMVDIFV